jgi:predicted TIM-barrel fold metal-dependent hydrolase
MRREITRREFLATIPASAGIAAQTVQPPFERIDTHLHLHRAVPRFCAGMEKSGWRALSICVSRFVGDEKSNLPEVLPATAAAARESRGRLTWATALDARGFESPEFASRAIADLNHWFSEGAIGVKIWKIIGMAIRGKSGDYLMPDNPALLPVYEAIQKSGRTLIAHLAEPNGAWMPLDDKNPEIGYYRNNPQWHMYGRPDVPQKESILEARDRVMARLPKLRVVGCHLGSNEDDLALLAKRLDRYPNFAVDCAARVRYLASGDRNTVREFLLKYQDRITYGTDSQIGNDEEKAWESLSRRLEEEWQFFASAGEMKYRNRSVQGLGLPEPVLRKIFRENARRWFPGIVAGA